MSSPAGGNGSRSLQQPSEFAWTACLCGQDGLVIHDFGVVRTRRELSSNSLVRRIGAERLADFLAAGSAHSISGGRAMQIESAGSTCNLQLHTIHTQYGILLFAAVPLGFAHVEEEYSTDATGGMPRDELMVQHDDAMARCAAMARHEEDTAKALRSTVHDLTNPISSIIGSCEYLSEYSPENLEPEQREMLSAIETSARMLLGLSAKLYELCGGGQSPK